MSDGTAPRLLPRVRFNAEVGLGHILQIIALTGAVVTAYVGLQRDLETQRSEYRVALAGFEGRLTVAEHGLVERRSEEREFAAEMRSALADIQRILTSIQIQAAGPQERRPVK